MFPTIQAFLCEVLARLISEGQARGPLSVLIPLIRKQSHRDLLSLDARPPERVDDLPSRCFLHIH